jgi:3',5'-cyclic AMP phosphodiesterase CpdA
MRIAHLSDLHLLSLEGVSLRRFMNKRLTGWVNLRMKRGSIHRAAYVRAITREIARANIDHVIVTGDLTNLALETEFDLAREVLGELQMDPAMVTVVPGNHDMYTRGAFTTRRFERLFAEWLVSDLPRATGDAGACFPVVKLRGPVAIVGLSSAVPRLPFVAAGGLGRPQLDALARVLDHPEVRRRFLVLALHHPLVQDGSRTKAYVEGLRDAEALLSMLERLSRGLVVHGHLHRRVQRMLPTPTGQLHHVGATSASLHHDAMDRMAGFNVYELDERGVRRIEATIYDPESDTFRGESVPRHV